MPLNALYGYAGFLLDLLSQLPPAPLAFAFDESLGSCFRNDLYPQYKASRELPDETLAFQLNACRQATERLAIPCYSGPRYEADDYLATLARRHRERGHAISILTRDKDLGQLIETDNDRWWDFSANEILDARALAKRFGVRPSQFADYLALVGDPVDDIPGVPGIGAKTAAALLGQFDDLESLLAAPDTVRDSGLRGAAGIARRLEENSDQARLARKLTGLADDITDVEVVPTYRLQSPVVAALAGYLDDLGLGNSPLYRRARALESVR